MNNAPVLPEKNLENEDSVLQDSGNTICPIFRTEIEVLVNSPEDKSDRYQNSLFLNDKEPDSTNKYIKRTSERDTVTSINRLSTPSLGAFVKHKPEITNTDQHIGTRHTFSFEGESTTSQKLVEASIFTEKIENSSEIPFAKIPLSNGTNLDVNSNELMTKLSDDENDFIPCIIRKSESVETVDKIEKELSFFVMDTKKKEKKRSSSFRKLFSVPFFGKDKKKKEKDADIIHEPSPHNKDNYRNETNSKSFSRNSPQRHTVGCDHMKNKKTISGAKCNGYHNIQEDPSPEVMKQYANHHINKFKKIRHSFEYPDDDKLSNIRNENTTNNHIRTIDPHITKYINTISSTSTLVPEKQNSYQNSTLVQNESQHTKQFECAIFQSDDKSKLARHESLRRETPPRAQDTYQLVNIVKPKARLPINSERPLPNPYQNDEEHDEKDNAEKKSTFSSQENETSPQLNEIYGTVFDAIRSCKNEKTSKTELLDSSQDSKIISTMVPESPKSPSLEMSKLKLLPNREILPSQPRMQSPLPLPKVSTEKIIATELLKNLKPSLEEKDSKNNFSPMSDRSTSSNGHFEELNIAPRAESTPDNKTSVSEAINALRSELEVNDHNLKQELDQIKSTLQNLSYSDSASLYAVKNVITNEGDIQKTSSKVTLPSSSRSSITVSPQSTSADAVRYLSNTQTYPLPSPNDEIVELRQKNLMSPKFGTQSSSRSPTSPSKEEIRRSVEAYYWKEIKKIKEQEDYEIYLSHLHFSQGGYAEDPIFSRRTRGIENTRARRSSSVPRSVRQQLTFDNTNQENRPLVIPEGSAVLYQPKRNDIYGYIPPKNSLLQDASRNSFQSSVSNSSRGKNDEYATYKPIFRRGSLSGNICQPVQINQYKKVSFSNSQRVENLACWPTKNGFTKSPPQRRLEKMRSNTLEDDVFLPPSVQNHQNVQYQSSSDEYNRLRMRNNYNSETESTNYDSIQNMDIYGYNISKNRNSRPINYSSDSEAFHSMQRHYKTLSHQELENLRNSQLKANNSNTKRYPVPLTRHESIQLSEPPYLYAMQFAADRRGSYRVNPVSRDSHLMGHHSMISHPPQRRDILITDDIYGQHIGYRNDNIDPIYGYSTHNNFNTEPLYVPKSVSVRNKVCDIYGRIHDSDALQGQIQATGVLVGQLQSSPSSPNFRRGTRLTTSNNDMLLRRRQDNFKQSDIRTNQPNPSTQSDIVNAPPVRPLPPLPPTGKKIQNENSKTTSSKKVTNSSKKKRK